MRKWQRKKLKDQKRILKLMYRTGWIDRLVSDLKHLAWESDFSYPSKRIRKRWNHTYRRSFWESQLHLFTVDYWGEGDSVSLVHCFKDAIAMRNAEYCPVDGWTNIDNSVNTDEGAIKYLKSLPIVRNDNQFNQCLKRNY